MNLIPANPQELQRDEMNLRAQLLIDAGWTPQRTQEGLISRTLSQFHSAQVSAGIWQIMIQLLSAHKERAHS